MEPHERALLALREAFPALQFAYRPTSDEERPEVKGAIYILGVTDGRALDTRSACKRAALAALGAGPLPFLLLPVDTKTARQHFGALQETPEIAPYWCDFVLADRTVLSSYIGWMKAAVPATPSEFVVSQMLPFPPLEGWIFSRSYVMSGPLAAEPPERYEYIDADLHLVKNPSRKKKPLLAA